MEVPMSEIEGLAFSIIDTTVVSPHGAATPVNMVRQEGLSHFRPMVSAEIRSPIWCGDSHAHLAGRIFDRSPTISPWWQSHFGGPTVLQLHPETWGQLCK